MQGLVDERKSQTWCIWNKCAHHGGHFRNWTSDCGAAVSGGILCVGTGRNPPPKSRDGFVLLPLEVTSNQSVTACVAEVQRQTGGELDVLINNVGTGILGAAEESSAEQVRQLFEINFLGAVRMTNAVLPMMRARQQGRILLLSSAGGVASVPFSGYYCATKHVGSQMIAVQF